MHLRSKRTIITYRIRAIIFQTEKAAPIFCSCFLQLTMKTEQKTFTVLCVILCSLWFTSALWRYCRSEGVLWTKNHKHLCFLRFPSAQLWQYRAECVELARYVFAMFSKIFIRSPVIVYTWKCPFEDTNTCSIYSLRFSSAGWWFYRTEMSIALKKRVLHVFCDFLQHCVNWRRQFDWTHILYDFLRLCDGTTKNLQSNDDIVNLKTSMEQNYNRICELKHRVCKYYFIGAVASI